MSTDLETQPIITPPHYRAVSLWGVLSMAFAVSTVTMFLFGWSLVLLPIAAVFCGRRALLQIRRLPEEYTGRNLALAGIWTGAVLGLGFSGWLFLGGKEVPHGYRVLDYSELEPDPKVKNKLISAAAEEMSDNKTKVYIRGYMLPPLRGNGQGISKFSICRNSDMCKFQNMGGIKIARPTDEIHVELTGDRTINYSSYQIGVGGIFSVEPDRGPGYYLIKADYVYP